jgi:hypothetical protein
MTTPKKNHGLSIRCSGGEYAVVAHLANENECSLSEMLLGLVHMAGAVMMGAIPDPIPEFVTCSACGVKTGTEDGLRRAFRITLEYYITHDGPRRKRSTPQEEARIKTIQSRDAHYHLLDRKMRRR